MAFPSTIAAVHEYLLEEPYHRFQAVLKTCISNAKELETYRFELTEETEPGDLVIAIIDIQWGPVGTMTLSSVTNFQIRFQITTPEYPELGEVPFYEPKLRAAFPQAVHSLEKLSIAGGYGDFLENLRRELHQMRLVAHRELKQRLLKSLKIYGYRCVTGRLNSKRTEGSSWSFNPTPPQEFFKFKVHSTRASVAALARSLVNRDEGREAPNLTCELIDPVTGLPLGNLIPELPKISVKLNQNEHTLDITAVSTSTNDVELQVRLLDEEQHWRLWDRLRDQLEKQKLFRLTGVHSAVDIANKKCPERRPRESLRSGHNGQVSVDPIRHQDGQELGNMEQNPDVNHQLILGLWRQGLTAKEIGQCTRRRPKTILNFLSSWRRKYGDGLVPRRRAS